MIRHIYSSQIGEHYIQATENSLLSENGDEIYRWRNIDDDMDSAKIIVHKNGMEYLIFRDDH